MKYKPQRLIQLVVISLSAIVFFASLYLQYFGQLQPCPLCLMQRACVLIIFIFATLSLCLKQQKSRQIMVICQVLFALAGLYFAGRHLWLMSLPASEIHACVPGIDILIRYFPWEDIAHALFWGSGDCTEITWNFLGLSLPAWSALYFLFVFADSSMVIFLSRKWRA